VGAPVADVVTSDAYAPDGAETGAPDPAVVAHRA
jgi:hypothetical protein